MRIGIDARELSGQPTGVGRYLAAILREWAGDECATRHEFVLYAPEALAIDLDRRRFVTRLVPGTPGTWWEQVRVPPVAAADHLDVFFAPAYTAPLRLEAPTVVTVHDLSYAAHPEWFRLREGARRRWITRRSVQRAAQVITVSAFSRDEIAEHFSLPAGRVRVIVSGIDPPVVTAAAYAEPRVLYVGSIFNRRRVPALIRAFAALLRRRPDAVLDIVGANRTHPYEDIAGAIERDGLSGHVRWHQYVSDERLRELYSRARAFAFLSEYEGFGMTPLEALAVGIPPVVLDTPVARETCGDAAIFVPKDDLPATTEALEAA
ncbi:MAG TPA: glycosyltransferase family 1 protein, partial [Vicinamibacterales bacterium]|nr:glycosyltransferase family 1 protein [Vicinamibacterales bacterium]